jgi:hypothetical protein
MSILVAATNHLMFVVSQLTAFQRLYFAIGALWALALVMVLVGILIGLLVVNPVFDRDWKPRWHELFAHAHPFFPVVRVMSYSGAVVSPWLKKRAFGNTDYDFRSRVSRPVYVVCAVIQLCGGYALLATPALLIIQLCFPELVTVQSQRS